MRPPPDISTRRRPGAGALSALVLLSLLMVSVDRLEASRPGRSIAVATAAGARLGVMGAPAPVRPTRALAALEVRNPSDLPPALAPAAGVESLRLWTLARAGLLDLPPPASSPAPTPAAALV